MRHATRDPSLPGLAIEHPRTLSAIVEKRLRDAIVNAELAFGQALPEDGTGLALGVSRTPMREALMRLAAQGLVTFQPKRGAFVFAPTVEDVRQLAEFRLMLEVNAVELSLETAPGAVLDGLRGSVAAMTQARRDADGPAYARADTAFHDCLFSQCGNAYLQGAYNAVSGRIAALRAHLSVPRQEEQAASFEEHNAVVAAFARGRAADIKAILTDHILRATRVYEAALANPDR